jgi:hypothetical protein
MAGQEHEAGVVFFLIGCERSSGRECTAAEIKQLIEICQQLNMDNQTGVWGESHRLALVWHEKVEFLDCILSETQTSLLTFHRGSWNLLELDQRSSLGHGAGCLIFFKGLEAVPSEYIRLVPNGRLAKSLTVI